MLLKALGARFGGAAARPRPARRSSRSSLATRHLTRSVVDGSGLSRSRPHLARSRSSTLLRDLSPTARSAAHRCAAHLARRRARRGTLEERMRGTRGRGPLQGKTGTLDGRLDLAGWCTDGDLSRSRS